MKRWSLGGSLAAAGWLAAAGAMAGTAATGMTLGGTARSLGMGGAGAAATGDAGGVWLNPATLGWLAAPELSFLHGEWVADIGVNQLTVAMPAAGGGAALGAAWTGMGEIDTYDAAGTKTGTFQPRDTSLTAAYGRGTGWWTAGAAVGWARSELATDTRASAWSGDAGGAVKPLPMLTIGASVQKAGGSLTWDREAAKLPLTIRAGAAADLPDLPVGLTLAADAVKSGDDDLSIRAGAEARREVTPGFDARLRAGWRTGLDAGGLSGLSIGASAGWKPEGGFLREHERATSDTPNPYPLTALRVEYAWTPMGDLGQAHWFSIGLMF
jgi:hypothetical protein